MKKLRIGYFADGPWSYKALDKLLSNKNIDIKFICVRFDSTDDTLKKYSDKYKINYFKNKNVNSNQFINKIKILKCDIFVSMSFNQIFKGKILSIPRLKTINCHAGKLPFYRGRNILNWVLINDEKEFGITVHYVDLGIDTGDIILQRTFPITDTDTYFSLLSIAYIECARILYDSLCLIISDKVKPVKQTNINNIGSYMRKRIIGDEILDWNNNSRYIFNFTRALCDPGPMARTFLNNKEMKINKVSIININNKACTDYGYILDISSGIYVKTSDGTICIDEYEYNGKIRLGDYFEYK